MPKAPEPLSRVATIIDAVGFSREGLSSIEIAEISRLPMPTVHRTLRNLVALGYLENKGVGTPYRLGQRLVQLIQPGLADEDVAEAVRPMLQRLADTAGAVAFLTRPGPGRTGILTAEILPQERSLSVVLAGSNMPLHATASGKIFLAALDETALDEFLSEPLDACRPATIVDPEELRVHLDLVRRRGYATCRDECDPGVFALAVSLNLGREGQLFACGIVGLPSLLFARVEEPALLKLVQLTAQEIAARLNGMDSLA